MFFRQRTNQLKPLKFTLTAVMSLLLCVTLIAFASPVIAKAGPSAESSPANRLYASLYSSKRYISYGDTVTFIILLHNSSRNTITADLVNELPDEFEYIADPSIRTLRWNDVEIPPMDDVRLEYDVKVVVERPGNFDNKVVITTADETIEIKFSFRPGTNPVDDPERPVVQSVAIGSSDVLTSRDVTVHIEATDNEGVKKMYLREWQFTSDPWFDWEVVQSSGWIDYEESISWRLGRNEGVHYIAVWVKDEDGNVSILDKHALDYASLLRSEWELGEFDGVPYLVKFEKGTDVTITADPESGDVDMAAWYPSNNPFLPNAWSIHEGSVTEQISFKAGVTGPYLIVVLAPKGATYSLDIDQNGPAMAAAQTSAETEYVEGEFTYEGWNLLDSIGIDPLATGTAVAADYTLHLPLLTRR
ncbi:MAG: hypothetical protein GX491_00405 [Chloroflexi bacterium]|nr:hypothetical protein [Chloroflexota bacterium]